MKYLVTGGAGFIGSNIAAQLLQDGQQVRVADNFATGQKENIQALLENPNFELLEGDITDPAFAAKAVDGVDIVFHEAAIPSVPKSVDDPMRSHLANATGTLVMLMAARDAKVKKFVYASSSSIYGDNPQLPKQEDFPVRPVSPYALDKYAGERYCQIFWKLYGLPTVALRYFNVFGPHQNPKSQYAAVIPAFITAIAQDQQPTVYGDGTQSRDFTFVQDVVQANLLAAQSGEQANGQVFNVACNAQTSLNDLITMINGILGKTVAANYQAPRKGDVPHSLADITKAKDILGYQPKFAIKEALQKTSEWYTK